MGRQIKGGLADGWEGGKEKGKGGEMVLPEGGKEEIL